ncbi:O-antigen translocase [Niabella sp. 22666]|uniref:O-antigen translocase n=1 Tax=Niabella sp. 22666 TaxID=3453954 RepID=UPI003F84A819
MNKQQSSYRQIFKATSIFGGVQVFNILISIIRSKIIAILLGPAGMGVFGLFSSTVNLITGLTNFGLGSSAVRNVASASQNPNSVELNRTVTIVRKLVWVTGLLGTITMFFTASWLSTITFGNGSYTSGFYWLAISLLFTQLTSGQNILLQGTRQLTYLARANIIGTSISLLVSVPVFYFYRVNGIVPSMILTSFVTMTIAYFFARKMKIANVVITRKKMWTEGRDMLKVGFLLSLSGFASLGESYLVRIFISNTGSMADVGFYNAGFAIIGTYVGMIFTAMGTDYYPRLSMVAADNKKSTELINQQGEIALLILSPILCVFLVFVDWAILLLYSQEFKPVNAMVHWAAIGMYFKAISWAIGFIFLAKGNGRLFFWSEMLAISYMLVFNICGYKFWGLEGLGISFLAGYVVCFFQVFFLAGRFYALKLSASLIKLFVLQLVLGVICFFIARNMAAPWNFVCGGIIIVFSVSYSIFQMDKRINFKEILQRKS